MSFANKNILLVNFDFPPNQGIGGRRWGKLSKGLAEEGFDVFVIKADPVSMNNPSPWTEDVKSARIHVTSLPRTYPEGFSHPGSGLIDKIKYRIHQFILSRKERGTIFDISIGWDKYLLPAAADLIEKHKIINVIATGAPWNLLYFVCRLKEKFPQINIISDFRDPWINAKNYGMQSLDEKRKSHEKFKHQYVLSHSDVIITPAKDMTDELRKFDIENSKANFNVLGHFYDEDDTGLTDSTATSDKIILVYGGDLYVGVEPMLNKFVSDLEIIRQKNPELYRRIEVRIFTNSAISSVLRTLDAIRVFPSVGKRIFEELRSAHFTLIFLPDNKKNHLTTKSIEYLPFRKPYLVYSPEGDFTRFVEENQLGFPMLREGNNPDEIILNNTGKLIDSPVIKERTLRQATEKLISLLK